MSTSHLSADRGSTLVEVTIASAVLAVSIMATLSAMATSRTATAAAKEETVALQLASERMNIVRGMGFQEIQALEGETAFDLAPGHGHGHAYAYGHLKGKNGELPSGLQRVTLDGDGTLVVEVSVNWTSIAHGREMSRSLFWRSAP